MIYMTVRDSAAS